MNQKTDEDIADLVQAARAYMIRSDLIRLDRESVQAAHRLGCVLNRFGGSAGLAATESGKAIATQS